MPRYNPQMLSERIGSIIIAGMNGDINRLNKTLSEFHNHWNSTYCQYYIRDCLGKLLAAEQSGRYFFGNDHHSPSFQQLFTQGRLLDLYSQMTLSIPRNREVIVNAASSAKTSLDFILLVSEGEFSDAVKTLSV